MCILNVLAKHEGLHLQGGVRENDASLTAYVVNGALECCQAPNHSLFTSVSGKT